MSVDVEESIREDGLVGDDEGDNSRTMEVVNLEGVVLQ